MFDAFVPLYSYWDAFAVLPIDFDVESIVNRIRT
jgi:hypothetical protein